VASVILAAAGISCIGPLGGIPAIILGLLALQKIRTSDPKEHGTELAWVGVVLGAVSTLLSVAFLALIVVSAVDGYRRARAEQEAHEGFGASWNGASSSYPGATASFQTETTEVIVGSIHIVDIGADVPSLETALLEQMAAAKRKDQVFLLQTTRSYCRPCLGVAAALSDPMMQAALAGVRLVRVDVDAFDEEGGVEDLGIDPDIVPFFSLLKPDLSPRDSIHGGEWDDDTAENIAPILGSFVRGTLKTRRYPLRAFPSPPTASPPPRSTTM